VVSRRPSSRGDRAPGHHQRAAPRDLRARARGESAQRAASAYFAPLVSPGIEEKLIANDYQWLVDTFARRAPAGLPLDAATLARYREAWGRPGALAGGLNYYRVSTLTRQSREAAAVPAAAAMTVTVPTLVVWGMSDVALLPGMPRRPRGVRPGRHDRTHSRRHALGGAGIPRAREWSDP
jgi:hypothetical protein